MLKSLLFFAVSLVLLAVNSSLAQNVGIGTAIPAQKLEIAGTNNTIRINGLKTGGTYNSSSTTANSNIVYVNNLTGDIYALPTLDNAILTTSATGVPTWSTSAISATAWQLTGNAGITNPAAPLTYGTSTFGAAENWMGTTDAKDLTFGTDKIERMRIGGGSVATAGYVGIGTSTPGYEIQGTSETALTIAGTNGSAIELVRNAVNGPVGMGELDWVNIGNTSGNQGIAYIQGLNTAGTGNGGGEIQFATKTSGTGGVAQERMRLSNAGNLGIATTTPQNKLDVSGAEVIGSYAGSTTAPANGLAVSGNVGVGTASPASSNGGVGEMLDVNSTASNNAVIVVSSNGTSGNGGGILEARTTAAISAGDSRYGQVDWQRLADVTANQVTSAEDNYINNNGTLVQFMRVISGSTAGTAFVGISTGNTPAQRLEVGTTTGTVRIDGLKSGSTFNSSVTAATSNLVYVNNSTGDLSALPTVANSILATNATGIPTWTSVSAATNAWSLTGNTISGTYGTNFLGTINAVPLEFVIGNAYAGTIDPNSGNSNVYLGAGITGVSLPGAGNNDGGNSNVGIGNAALASVNSSAIQNVAIGYLTLPLLTSGSNNIAMGQGSQRWETTGSGNSGLGVDAIFANTTGSNNSAVGFGAMQGVPASATAFGSFNVAMGYNSLFTVGAGSASNTSIGSNALYNNKVSKQTAVGDSAMASNTTGTQNTALGYQALSTNTTGTGNTALGYDANVSSAALTNATAIGANAIAAASNTIQEGNTSITGWFLGADLGVVDASGTKDNVSFGPSGNGYGVAGNSDAGEQNVGIGMAALGSYTASSGITGNVAVGAMALPINSTGLYNTSVGSYSSRFSTGSQNTALGSNALQGDGAGNNNTSLGFESMVFPNGSAASSNVAVGAFSLQATASNMNVGVGDSTLWSLTSGENNTAIGFQANVNSGAISNATVIGANAIAPASNSVTLGNNSITGVYIPGSAYNTPGAMYYTSAASGLLTAISPGTSGQVLQSNGSGAPTWVTPTTSGTAWQLNGNAVGYIPSATPLNYLGTNSSGGTGFQFGVSGSNAGRIEGGATVNTALGYLSLNPATTGTKNSALGARALNANTTGSQNSAVGNASLFSNTSGSSNSALGFAALADNISGSSNTGIGVDALNNNSLGGNNSALGYSALAANTTGNNNVAVGIQAMYSNTTGASNVAVGEDALYSDIIPASNGSQNTAIGTFSLYGSISGAAQNTAVGDSALTSNTTGAQNTALGYNANVSSGALTNATAIGANASVAQSNSLVLGSINGVNGATANTSVGIGTNTPNSTLHINGSMSVAVTNILPAQSPYNAGSGDYIVEGDCSGGNITINLPDATTMKGRIYYIVRYDATFNSANVLTVGTTNNTATQNNVGPYGASISLSNNYEQEYIASDGHNWLILGSSKMQ